MKRKLFALATTWLLAGCPGPTFIVQQYTGPVRPRETVAILRTNANDEAKLLFLDDQDIGAPVADDGRLHIEILPARHTVQAARASMPTERYPSVAFDARADHVYRVVFNNNEPHIYEVDRIEGHAPSRRDDSRAATSTAVAAASSASGRHRRGDALSTVRWGILGPGRIAEKLVKDFAVVPNAMVTAVASRSLERAQSFAARHSIPHVHGAYDAMLRDPEVDAIYIATPHRQHRDIAIAALEAGKGILVEKAFTTTVAGAEAVIAAARRTKCFAMEAMWTRFQPLIVEARALIAKGVIGELRGVQADLGVDRPYVATDRLFDMSLGGGAMLDLGVYVVSFAQMILGTPKGVVAQGTLLRSGADAEVGLLLDHGEGRRAVLYCTLRGATPGQARIFGSEGWLDILPRFHHPTEMIVQRTGEPPRTVTMPPLGAGYSHELIEVTECISSGRHESAIMSLADTLDVQRVMETACEQIGVIHTEES